MADKSSRLLLPSLYFDLAAKEHITIQIIRGVGGGMWKGVDDDGVGMFEKEIV